MTTTDKGAKAPTLCIGWHTINRLRKEGMVEVNGVGLIAADDLFAAHPAPAPAPEIPEEMVEKVAALLIDRGHYRVLDEADAAAWEILAGAGVPALLAEAATAEFWKAAAMRCDCVGTFRELEAARDDALARVAEVEGALHHIAEAGTDPHSARVARAALAKKESS